MNVIEALRAGRKGQVWDHYCGFLDLELEAFLEAQRKQLEEQLRRLAECPLGRSVFGGQVPRTAGEFRRAAPLTTYKDYAPLLLERREEELPEKPYTWVRTSGRSGEYQFKWLPYTRRLYELGGEHALACMILAAARSRGQVNLKAGMSFLYTIAPPPYVSGIFTESLIEQFSFRVFPPTHRARQMEFQDRIKEAFRLALSGGLDFFYGVSSILLSISDQFSSAGSSAGRGSLGSIGFRAALRLARALLAARLRGRSLLPRHIWTVRGAVCGGMDTSIFKDKVAAAWGVAPLEAYGSTECGISATQSWTLEGLTFFPGATFWEFIGEEDYRRLSRDPSYRPRVLDLSEVRPGREYVLVGTSLHGGALVRYIVGDLIRITAPGDPEAGVRLPQAAFSARIDGVIDIGGFTRLTEKVIWQAVENAGLPYTDWAIVKETDSEQPTLHLYIEPKDSVSPAEMGRRVHECLKELDEPYRDLEKITGLKPLRVSILSRGTFRRYFEERQAAGADLAHLKPAHVNPSPDALASLLRMSAWKL